MTRTRKFNPPSLTPLLLAMLLSACASGLQPPSPPVVVQPPALSTQARQPAKPSICHPSCSEFFRIMQDNLLSTQTVPALPAKPASSPTTH